MRVIRVIKVIRVIIGIVIRVCVSVRENAAWKMFPACMVPCILLPLLVGLIGTHTLDISVSERHGLATQGSGHSREGKRLCVCM